MSTTSKCGGDNGGVFFEFGVNFKDGLIGGHSKNWWNGWMQEHGHDRLLAESGHHVEMTGGWRVLK